MDTNLERVNKNLERERESNKTFVDCITERISVIDLEIMQLTAKRDALKLALDDFEKCKAAK